VLGTADAETAVLDDDANSEVGDLEVSNADAEAEIAEASLTVEEVVSEQDDEAVAELTDVSAEAEAHVEEEAEAEVDAADDEGDVDTDEDGSPHRD
jgi:segregation and condensation protein B